MTSKEKIEFLKQYGKINQSINRLCEEYSQWKAQATKISPVYSNMPKGGQSQDKIQTSVEKMMEIEKEINTEIDELTIVRKNVKRAIRSVSDETLRTLLEYRYIGGYTWEKIAVRMNYSYMHVCRLHGKALNQVKM